MAEPQALRQESKHSVEVAHKLEGEYKARIGIALRQPRDLKAALSKCLDEAELSGELFYYNWTVKSKRRDGSEKVEIIEGPSYPLAKSALRNFGNCDAGMLPVHETSSAWIFTGRFIDLESNASITRQFRQDRKSIVYGRMDDARKSDIRFQIGQSKCLRNVILAGIPEAFVEKMMQVAKQAMRNKIDTRIQRANKQGGGIENVRNEILKAFERYGITQQMIEDKFDLNYKAWDAEFLTRLSGDLSALQHNSETPDTLYPELKNGTDEEDKPESDLEESMAPGDPATHQGYEDKPKEKLGVEPEPEEKPDRKADPTKPILKEQARELGELADKYKKAGGFTDEQHAKYRVRIARLNRAEALAEIETMKLQLNGKADF